MAQLTQYLRNKLIQVAILFLALLLVASTLITWYNKEQLVSTARVKSEAEMLKYSLYGIFERTLRSMDLGLRGFALTGNRQMLGPYNSGLTEHPINLRKIDSLLKIQKLDTAVAKFAKIKVELNNYLAVCNTMLTELEKGNKEEFLRLMTLDKGYDAWRAFAPFYRGVMTYEDKLIATAQSDYESAMNGNLVFQITLLFTGSFIMFLIWARLRKDTRIRGEVFSTLDLSGKKYLFNSGEKETNKDQSGIISDVIENFKKASSFISSITQGNYQVKWEGLNEQNEKLNAETLAGQLHQMKDKLIAIRQEEEKRNWSNQGLTNYSEVVRKFQNNLDELCFESIKFLTKYIQAQQGGLFVVTEDENEKYLMLKASYAFEKKKFIEKRVAIGEGLIGQTYLEGGIVKLTEVPEGYTHITSGLGDATARCVIIVPLKHNEVVVAILEIASLYIIPNEHIKFVERCGEFLSSALSNAQTNTQIRKLLQDTQLQTESMKSQEEEMRQNMEELTATQEEMQRQGSESKGMFQMAIAILNELPQKVFLKDEKGKIILANSNVAKAHDLSVEQLIGKSDFDFVDAKTAQAWRDQELEIVRKGKESYVFDETLGGHTKKIASMKMAFYIPHLKQTGLLGIQTDLTAFSKMSD